MTQTPTFDFDTLVERRDTGSTKWTMYGEDVLPMWVADMDFQSPPAVLDALRQTVDHGVFGYMFPPQDLPQLIVERMASRYNWTIQPEDVLFVPGVMVGVNMTARAVAQDGAILIQPPVYYPFHYTPAWSNCGKQEAPLAYVETEDGFTYEIDFDILENTITPETKMLLFCSPHNPIGRVWQRDELERLADLCIKHDLILCADEIHSDLLMGGVEHIPAATVREEMRDRTVTLIAPSKTFNIPGLSLSVAIIENPDLRRRFVEVGAGTVMIVMGDHAHPFMNMMGYIGATAAYRDGDPWLEAVLHYIEGNRDFAQAYMREHMPEVKLASLEGTYLQWLDFRAANLPDLPGKWLLENAKVALNEGRMFGADEGTGFARMNLGTSRARIEAALGRIRTALDAR
jgi:cysteine-S-conjugate beta-lyase